MHEHNTCDHELKYCRICNVVYCEKCGSQWYSNQLLTGTTWRYLDSPIIEQNPDRTYVTMPQHNHNSTGG